MYDRWGKRTLDIVAALLLLLALSPVFAAVALAVRVGLGAPVIFTQPRAGRGGRAFRLLKFRSMAEGDAPDADRQSPVGRRLRASRLDELPQQVNVLFGEMSLVGPRPLPLAYVRHYSRREALRLRVRPGLFGPGVAAGRKAVPSPQRLDRGAADGQRPARRGEDQRLVAASLRGL